MSQAYRPAHRPDGHRSLPNWLVGSGVALLLAGLAGPVSLGAAHPWGIEPLVWCLMSVALWTLAAWTLASSPPRHGEPGPVVGAMALGVAGLACAVHPVAYLFDLMGPWSHNHLNLATFMAAATLGPAVMWGMFRPQLGKAAAWRPSFRGFQIVLAAGAIVFALVYMGVYFATGLALEPATVVWGSLAQVVLMIETIGAAAVLCTTRPNERRRWLAIAALLVPAQLVAFALVYGLESQHIALTGAGACVFTLASKASPYWLAALVVLWAAGLGLCLAALLRERDRRLAEDAEDAFSDAEAEADEDEDEDKQRWLH